jgi:transcriptional regulator GlxA family with amidase domain
MRGNLPRNAGATAARRAVVDRAEAYVHAHFDARISLSRLCRVTGVSERALRNAFYAIHGVGPKRWMIAERLSRTQMALRASRHAATTVTAIATDHGFYELGRFAAIYKKTFGEAPSETLHPGFIRGRSTHKPLKEHSDATWI